MDRVFKISQGVKISDSKTGVKGEYVLGQIIETKTATGDYTERFYEGLSLDQAINQVLKSNGVDISSEALLESLLEIATHSDNFSEDMKKLFAKQNKNETISEES